MPSTFSVASSSAPFETSAATAGETYLIWPSDVVMETYVWSSPSGLGADVGAMATRTSRRTDSTARSAFSNVFFTRATCSFVDAYNSASPDSAALVSVAMRSRSFALMSEATCWAEATAFSAGMS